ncbi:1-deoxy-D-xylulose-5-phosphate reductoisomerase [Kangiella koreensis]|uniref:1-deoxy-D-xylulose 5-phosphate reductoisomerase n=1 Tax=Kangiella koreensis (strain DSM 16069 / JCM 12317 / KCTC 12182 / SW-125) TaxID=523791 RepID=C7R5Z2_KANKD|nr:1-deoxy-D-xylulose-5-phosphate reductoisomerase [Kangiella koreensis]ACV27316.1 1-deoxy-D-xylulose 5-phosphate reductoisomerase [Kangiella koreensis DSM 16069]
MSIQRQSICILGATGSIGTNTLDVIRRHPERYHVFALTANQNIDLLFKQCLEFEPEYAVLTSEEHAELLQAKFNAENISTKLLIGIEELAWVASHKDVDTVMAAIVGAAGLIPTLAAVKASKKVLLANKEALVMSGAIFMQAVSESGATLLPIDSEHNAIFQCLPEHFVSQGIQSCGIHSIVLTGSGGPFLKKPLAEFPMISPDEACAHPNWSMGRKISVDSATMMNKGLELIEACWLFDVQPEQVEVILHPQSIIHSMVRYQDGSVLAQMGNPDMRTPIAHAMAFPERISAGVEPLDFMQISQLTFEQPSYERYPCLKLAKEAMTEGGNTPARLNAANEVAVAAFLDEKINFDQIASVIQQTLTETEYAGVVDLKSVLAADRVAREHAQQIVEALSTD